MLTKFYQDACCLMLICTNAASKRFSKPYYGIGFQPTYSAILTILMVFLLLPAVMVQK